MNHKAAIELLVEQVAEIGFNRYTILNLHALLSDNLLGDPQAGGRLRNRPVGIDGTVYHPLAVPQLVDECFQQICDTATAIRWIARESEKRISVEDRARFIEVVETELISLHEGNLEPQSA